MRGDRVNGGSTVRLRPLSKRREAGGWIVGRVETGDFISIPDVAHRAMELLDAGQTVECVAATLRAETGTNLAVDRFAAELDELGFVAAVDGQAREDDACPRPSLPWLRPRHVRWLLSPVLAVAAFLVAVAVVAMLVSHPALFPRYRYLAWSRHAGLALAVDAVIAWTLICLHELGHLATARAAGAPSRITLSTRLQFLAAQTDVSGVWAAPRRTRMTVYLAGMTVDLCTALACLLILAFGRPRGLAGQLITVASTEALLMLPTQLMVFMRTDLYFVLQDLTGCANLYADGSGYVRYLLRRRRGPDPSAGYPRFQRRAVRWYSALLVAGTAVCLGIEFTVSLPALITLLARAARELFGGAAPARLDGAAALAVLVTWQILWAWRWWSRHAPQVRRLLTRQEEVTP